MKIQLGILTGLAVVALSLANSNPVCASMTFDAIQIANLGNQGNGAGTGWIDYDNDGDMDFYVVNNGGPNLLWRNNGDADQDGNHDGFSVVLPTLVPPLSSSASRGVVIADFDGDGWDDIFVANEGKNTMLQNKQSGFGGFEDVTDAWGLGGETYPSHAGCAGDVDDDGDLDLLVVHWTGGVALANANDYYRNDADPQDSNKRIFTKIDVGLGQDRQLTFSCTFSDYNNDGTLDAILVNDNAGRPPQPTFYRNQSGTFVQDTAAPILDDMFAMGVGIGDVNSDGRLDYYFTDIVTAGAKVYNRLLLNLFSDTDGNTSFLASDFLGATGATGPLSSISYWGASFADLDNDADVDLYTVNAVACSDCPAALYENRLGEGSLFELVQNSGAGIFNGVGLATADYDKDGKVDMLVYGQDGQITLLHNTSTNTGNWIELNLLAGEKNRRGVGARVEVTATVSGSSKTLVREVTAGGSHSSTDSRRLHFGLGDAAVVDSISVRWPDGCTQMLNNLGVNFTYIIVDLCN